RLARERFDAVFAKLEQMSIFIRARPGAALAIEAIFLVHLEPIADCAHEAGFSRSEFHTLEQRVHSACGAIRLTQARFSFFLRLRPGCWSVLLHVVIFFAEGRAQTDAAPRS